jgi:hypothetical protein
MLNCHIRLAFIGMVLDIFSLASVVDCRYVALNKTSAA